MKSIITILLIGITLLSYSQECNINQGGIATNINNNTIITGNLTADTVKYNALYPPVSSTKDTSVTIIPIFPSGAYAKNQAGFMNYYRFVDNTSEELVQIPVPKGTIKRVSVHHYIYSTGGTTATCTLMKNGVETPLTFSILNPVGTYSASGNVAVNQNDLIDIKINIENSGAGLGIAGGTVEMKVP
jgi:hypothetical protein